MKKYLGSILALCLAAMAIPLPAKAGAYLSQPNLYIIAVGVNDYKDPTGRLLYAKADAQDLADSLERVGTKQFTKISKQVLLNEQATHAAIEAAFNKVAAEVRPNDVFVFHFAGQGSEVTDEQVSAKDLYLFTIDVEKLADPKEQRKGISATELSAWSSKIPARNQLIVLDSCKSDAAFEKIASRIVGPKEIAAVSGRSVVILGTDGQTPDGFIYKGNKIGHGLVTYALLQVLSDVELWKVKNELEVLTSGHLAAVFNCKFLELSRRLEFSALPKTYSVGDDFRLALSPKSAQNAKAQEEKVRATLASASARQEETNTEPGTNYALFFATDTYDDKKFDSLNNPIHDANAIAEALQKYYGFDTLVVQNPTLKETVATIFRYQKKTYKASDQLFIFFAGHGTVDGNTGYVVAKDSKSDDEEYLSYLPYTRLKDAIDTIKCSHIFLALDVCFGGTFIDEVARNAGGKYREGPEKDTAKMSIAELMRRKVDKQTRKILTSGAAEVFDGKPGEHSPFAKYFLDVLETYGGNEGYLTFEDICKSVERIKPGPISDNFGRWEAGSNFFFVASKEKTVRPLER